MGRLVAALAIAAARAALAFQARRYGFSYADVGADAGAGAGVDAGAGAGRAAVAPWAPPTAAIAAEQLRYLDENPPPGAPASGCHDAQGRPVEAGPREPDPARGARVAVVTQAEGAEFRTAEISAVLSSQERWTAQHGYDYVMDNHTEHAELQGEREEMGKGNIKYWGKWFAISRLLPKYDWVLWMDSDMFINNMSYTLEDIVGSGGQDIVFRNAPAIVNNGVIALKNSCFSRQFLREWWNDGSVDDWMTSYDNGPFFHAVFRTALRDLQGGYDHSKEEPCLQRNNSGQFHFDESGYTLYKGADEYWPWPCLMDVGPRRGGAGAGAGAGAPFFTAAGGPAATTRHLRAIQGEPPGFNLLSWEVLDREPHHVVGEYFMVHFAGGDKEGQIRTLLGPHLERVRAGEAPGAAPPR